MVETYIPGCRTSLGATELPNGKAYNGCLVRYFTTLDISPEDVHRIGLGEVERIRAEMEELIESSDSRATSRRFSSTFGPTRGFSSTPRKPC